MNSRAQYHYKSTLCDLYLVASEIGLQGVFWKKQSDIEFVENLRGSNPAVLFIKQALEQISEYLEGKRTFFDIPLDIQGTDFQKKVWLELAQIPYGKTVSYSDIAVKIKNKKAVRAVGTANSKNPLSLILPCHRVIGADGKLTGYAGGLPIKARLLELESRKS